jgi:hypothetical protein
VLNCLFSPGAWSRLCDEAAQEARDAALGEESFHREQVQAREDAQEHFRGTLARRDRPDARAAEEALRDLIMGLLRQPVAHLDALGACVLSERFPDESEG